jgi:hypothetical protein
MSTTELYVKRGSATREELQETIDEILAEIAVGEGELADEARAAGMTVDADTKITVQEDQGFEPISMLALAFLGGVGKGLASKFWDDVVRPEIRRRRGADSVGDRHDG